MARASYLIRLCFIAWVMLAVTANKTVMQTAKPTKAVKKDAPILASKLLVESKVAKKEMTQNLTANTNKTNKLNALSHYEEFYIDPIAEDMLISEDEQEIADETEDDVADAEALDARSAYINNAFIPDETVPSTDNSPPLYELLQKQMEHVLAATGQDYGVYPTDNSNSNRKKTKSKQNVQNDEAKPPGKPSFGDYIDNTDYAEPDSDTSLEANSAEQLSNVKITTNNAYTATMPKPELPKPILTRRPLTHKHTTTSSTTAATPLTSLVTPLIPLISNAYAQPPSHFNHAHPHLSSSIFNSNYQKRPAVNAAATSSLTALMPTANSTVHMHRRRIAFKTVSTSSQFVATPLADLMFKFSIGIAKPSKPLVNSSSSNQYGQYANNINDYTDSSDETLQYNNINSTSDKIDLPKRSRPVVAQNNMLRLRTN